LNQSQPVSKPAGGHFWVIPLVLQRFLTYNALAPVPGEVRPALTYYPPDERD